MITFGEFHNNHYRFPLSAKQGYVWWEVDVGYWLLRGLAAVGLIWDLRLPHLTTAESPTREDDPA